MRRQFAETESQILFLMMVCKMRGLNYREIQEEIVNKLHVDMSINTIRSKIDKMTRSNVEEFHDLKQSNDAYISRVIELKNHMEFYRRQIYDTLYAEEWRKYVNPRLIYKAIEVLKEIDTTEFAMLKAMPELFAWGGVRNSKGRDSVFGDQSKDLDKTIDQFVISMEQIAVPRDLEAMQKETEDKNLGAFQQKSDLEKKNESK